MALLPSAKKSKETQDPKNLIIFSQPKVKYLPCI